MYKFTISQKTKIEIKNSKMQWHCMLIIVFLFCEMDYLHTIFLFFGTQFYGL